MLQRLSVPHHQTIKRRLKKPSGGCTCRCPPIFKKCVKRSVYERLFTLEEELENPVFFLLLKQFIAGLLGKGRKILE